MANMTPEQIPPPYGVATGALPERPDSMKRAIALMWGGAGLSLVYYVVDGVVTHDWLTVQTTNTGTFHNTTYGGDIIPALVGIALWLWMIWKVRAGRQWARVLATVFFGFLCLEFLLVVTSGPGISRLLITTYVIFGLLAIVMLYQRDSSAYFSAATLARNWLRTSRMQQAYGQPGYGQNPGQYGVPPQPGAPQSPPQ